MINKSVNVCFGEFSDRMWLAQVALKHRNLCRVLPITKHPHGMPFLARPRPSQARISQDTASQGPAARKAQVHSHSNVDLTFTLRNGMSQQEVSLMTAFGKESFRGCQRQVIEAALD